MCGISGLISFRPRSFSLIESMNNVVRHRGPDDEGYILYSTQTSTISIVGGVDTPEKCFNSTLLHSPTTTIKNTQQKTAEVMLGHRRLAIVDVSSAGHQPMCTSDGNCWIVYNGEVYNYSEIRDELIKSGIEFKSHTDTEVVLAAYQKWGRECLHRFNGMFAFIIFDISSNIIFVARDRFGVKPIYYWLSDDLIAFASEIKQFSVLPGWKAFVNGQRAYEYLNSGITDHTDETLFKGVYQLRGGEALELPLKKLKQKLHKHNKLNTYRWYELRPARFEGDLSEATRKFRSLLTDSISLRQSSEVALGSCLSGGLDSSSIVSLLCENYRLNDITAKFNTFSACSKIKEYDERDYIEEVVRQTGVEAHYVYPSIDNLFAINPKITWHQDEPFGSTSIYAQWHVFNIARKNKIKVMLDGQGADELLAGYSSFFAPRLVNLLTKIKILSLMRELFYIEKYHGLSKINLLMQVVDWMLPSNLRSAIRAVIGMRTGAASCIDMALIKAATVNPPMVEEKSNALRAHSLALLTANHLPMLLHWEDRNSMAHSIEARVPFLDYRLVEHVLGLPDEYKLYNGTTKYVLRKSLETVLPVKIFNRMDKLGFATPEQYWMMKQPQLFKNNIDEAIANSHGILTKAARYKAHEIIDGHKAFNYFPWRVISFGEWMKTFNLDV